MLVMAGVKRRSGKSRNGESGYQHAKDGVEKPAELRHPAFKSLAMDRPGLFDGLDVPEVRCKLRSEDGLTVWLRQGAKAYGLLYPAAREQVTV